MENNKYNMVAVDLDGTLVKNDKTISRTTKKVFIELQKRGVRLILASGRCVLGISQVAKQLELGRYGGYMLAFNGGRIIDASNNKTMFSNEIAVDLYSRIFEIRNEYNLDILSYNKEQNCLISNNILNKFAELDSKINNMKLIEVKDFENYVTYKEPKFLMDVFLNGSLVEKNAEKELKVCQFCLEALHYKGYDYNKMSYKTREEFVNNFSFEEFLGEEFDKNEKDFK